MNEKTLAVLEYDQIKEKLKEFTVSNLGRKLVDKLKPATNIEMIKRMLNDTSEAKTILNRSGRVPLQGLHGIKELIEKIEKGGVLSVTELLNISDFLSGCRRMNKFMKGQEAIAPVLSSYRYSMTDLGDIEAEINNSIEGSTINSNASNNLSKIRKKIGIAESRIEEKLKSILSSNKYKNYIQEFFVSNRNGKFVIPIKASYKNKFEGNIIETSSTGSTVFIEPASISKFSNELASLKAEEEVEEYQILATLTNNIAVFLREIKINVEVMAEYDFVFAKAKYSNAIKGKNVEINDEDYIKIIKGRHPLLGENAVDLDFEIGSSFRTLIITGPNTGGKTVALKTIGLLTLMVQSGLHIRAEEGTKIAIFKRIFSDIGDNQSIKQSLSTFSGHISNIIEIMNKTSFSTLILLDEIGTGTDPSEGAGLAVAILAELYSCGAITIATTHYGEIKDFADQHKGFENGSMQFDPETLMPLYKLIIGKAGESNALWIARKLGMGEKVLKMAEKYIKERGSNGHSVKFEIVDDLKLAKQKKISEKENNPNKNGRSFSIGDSVIIKSSNERGIVYQLEDDYGDLIVFVKDEYRKINHKRVALDIKKEELYPEGYNLDTIFVPWKKRKFEKDLARGAVKKKDFKKRLEELDG